MENFNPQFEKLGDILIHDGCIDESQLSEALEEGPSGRATDRALSAFESITGPPLFPGFIFAEI